MAAKGKSTSKAGTSRARHSDPVTVAEILDEIPRRPRSSAMDGVLEQIIAAEGRWVRLNTGGRQPSSVQSMVSSLANKQNLKINCSVTEDDDGVQQVYARLAPAKTK